MIERGKGSSEGATSPKILLRFLRNWPPPPSNFAPKWEVSVNVDLWEG